MVNNSPKKPANTGALAAAVVALIGTAVGITVAYQNAGIRKEVDARAKQLAKQFKKTRAGVQKNVREIFGKVSLQLEKKYLEVHSHVLAATDQLKTLAKDNQKNIDAAIEQIVLNFAKAEKWSKENADKFAKMLKEEWEKQSTAKKTAAKSAKPAVKKALVRKATPPKKSPAKKVATVKKSSAVKKATLKKSKPATRQ